MVKDRITPCLYYVCAGECKKGRQNITDAVKSVIKKQELEKSYNEYFSTSTGIKEEVA